jgi:hypothetical protein
VPLLVSARNVKFCYRCLRKVVRSAITKQVTTLALPRHLSAGNARPDSVRPVTTAYYALNSGDLSRAASVGGLFHFTLSDLGREWQWTA